ncbi:MAG: hypothetical protein IKW07_01600 [Clostridia bacterium]|nr:hypothetical protein [Clostridia bacterium]
MVKGVLCALALVCAFALGQGDKGYTENDLALAREEAYNSGYHTGYDEGLAAQQEAIYQEAFAAGQAEGYDSGYDTGFSEGSAQTVKDEQRSQQQYVTAQTPVLPSAVSSQTVSPAETQESQQVTVYITNSGIKYHLDGCRHLKSKIEKTLEEAKALKLEPCKVCNPPK